MSGKRPDRRSVWIRSRRFPRRPPTSGSPGMPHINLPARDPQPACGAGACTRLVPSPRGRATVPGCGWVRSLQVVAAVAARLLVTDVNGLTFSRVPRWVGSFVVDPRCLLAAVDRGDGPSNPIGLLVPSGVTTRGHRSLAVLAAPCLRGCHSRCRCARVRGAPGPELLATQAAGLGFAQCLLRALSCRLVTGLLASMDATSAEAPRTGMLCGWPVI
jgi:hypothetical protein